MRTRLIAFIVVLVLAAAGGLGYFLLRKPEAPITVVTAPASTGTIARQVLATATATAAKTVDVGTQLSGTIATLPVDFNSLVKAGQVVATLDPAVYDSQLQAAKAALEQAQADANQMRATMADALTKYKRAQELKAQDLVSQSDLDTAKTTYDQAAADVKSREASILSAQGNVKQAQVDLDRTVIRSPLEGIVVNRAVSVGQTVAASFSSPVLFTIADLKKMQLLTEINEGEMGGVQPGSPVTYQVDSLGQQSFPATVSEVRLQPYSQATAGTTGTAAATPTSNATSASGSSNNVAAPGAVTYTAVINVDNADGRLSPGTTAIVSINSGQRRDVVRVPNNALSFRPSQAMLDVTGQSDMVVESPTAAETGAAAKDRTMHVWRFENNKFVPVAVMPGLSDDQWTEVVSGEVKNGDTLVTSAVLKKK